MNLVLRILILSTAIMTHSVYAALFNITLIDNDGPSITGVVDTSSDTFTINSWTENSPGIDYWVPTSGFPIVLFAEDAFSSTYDVPDNWDGTIGNTWGFVLDGTTVTWNQSGDVSETKFGWGGNANFFGNQVGTAQNFFHPYETISTIVAIGNAELDSISIVAVPEPSTWILSAIALSACAFALRRRR